MQELLAECFDAFFARNVAPYAPGTLPVHFTGSIAFHFRKAITQAAQRRHPRRAKATGRLAAVKYAPAGHAAFRRIAAQVAAIAQPRYGQTSHRLHLIIPFFVS